MTTLQENIDKQSRDASYQTKEEEKVNERFPREDTESVSVTSKDQVAALDPTSENQLGKKVMQECFD